MIEIYNTRLTERERRRQFVMDRKLINIRKQQNLDRRRSPAEREMYARLKAVARYLPQQEFEVLSDGVVTETRLRSRIQVLTLSLWESAVTNVLMTFVASGTCRPQNCIEPCRGQNMNS